MADHRQITSFIRKWEGGLSKSKKDSASADPVPDGSGYHTNKGITWKTFKSLAPKLGYIATPKLFYGMPDEIWDKIFKYGYWNVIRGDEIKSQAVADTLVDYAWNAGPGRAIQQLQKYLGLPQNNRMDNATLAAVNRANEQALHEGFSKYKEAWYKSLHQSANEAGWMNRLDDLYAVTRKKLADLGANKTVLMLVGVGIGFGALLLTINYLSSK